MTTFPPTGPPPPPQPSGPPAGYAPIPAGPAPYPPPYPGYFPAGMPTPTTGVGYAPPAPESTPDPMPAPGTTYHQFLRTGRNRWWKGLLAIVALVMAFLVESTILAAVATGIEIARGRIDPNTLGPNQIVITPLVMLSINLGLAALIPLSMVAQWVFYGQPVRWMHGVRGYVRFDLLRRTALIIVPIFVVYVLATIFLFPSPPSGPFTAESVGLLVVVLLTTPLQAAGEEYAARGLIQRAAGSWVADPRISLLISTAVSAALFCLAHGAGDPWLIGYFFFFGAAMSVVVWRTGGLEVAVLIHTVNNLLLFVVAIVMGQDLGAGLDRSDGTGGPWMLIPMLVLTAITAVVWWWAQRQQLDRTYQPVR